MQTLYLQVARYVQARKMFNCCPSVVFVLFLTTFLFAETLFAAITPGAPGNFITRWKTHATTGPYNVELKFWAIDGSYDIYVKKADGSGPVILNSTAVSGVTTITGLAPGTEYRIETTGVLHMNAKVPGLADESRKRLLDIEQWGTTAWTNFENAFYECRNLQITAQDAPILTSPNISMKEMFSTCINLTGAGANWTWSTANVTNMGAMFYRANNFNGTIGSWNVSNVVNMKELFHDAYVFNQPLTNWNPNSATNMESMFHSAKVFNQSLNHWNVSNVTNMNNMFNGATVFNGQIGTWNTDNVTMMYSMFYQAQAFNQDISNWNTSNVTTMYSMFYQAYAFNQDISNWNTSNVTTMYSMFYQAYAFNQDISNWNTSNVTTMYNMFYEAKAFNQDIGNWDVSKVTTMHSMFNEAVAFNQDLNSWDVSKVTAMSYMFYNAKAFNGNISNWTPVLVITMERMFYGATNFNQDIENWATSNVINMTYMFYMASSFNGKVTNWNTASVGNMAHMFDGASAFNQDVGNWNVSNVTNMERMFNSATVFNNGGQASINNWIVSKVTKFASMFTNALAFNQPIGNWSLYSGQSATVTLNDMFNNAQAFNQDIGNWHTARVSNFNYMFNNAYAFNQNLGNWNMSYNATHTNMLQNSGLDCENFSLTIIGWAIPQSATYRNLGSVSPLYYAPWAQAAVTELTNTLHWTMTGATLGNPGTISVNGQQDSISLCVNSSEIIASSITEGTWDVEDSSIASVTATNPLFPGTLATLSEGSTYVRYSKSPLYGGCYSRYKVIVTTTDEVIAATTNSPVCEGQTIELKINNIGPSVTYTGWIGANGTIYDDVNDVDLAPATPSMAGEYTAKVIFGGCTKTETFNVEVINTPAQPGLISGSQSVCSNATEAYLIDSVTHATSYNWTYTGNGTPTQTTNNISFTPGTSGTLSVVAINNCGTSIAINTPILVTTAVSAGIIAGKNNLCLGDSDFLYSTSSDVGTWSSSHTNKVSISPSGEINGLEVGTSNITYNVPANGPCPADASTYPVTVVPIPTANVSVSGTTFSVETAADQSYQWVSCLSFSDNEIVGATTPNFAPSTAGVYAVVVTNLQGCKKISDCKPYNYGDISDTGLDDLLDSLNKYKDSTTYYKGKLSVEDNQIDLISLSPNPTTDITTLNGLTSPATISITDANGKILSVQQSNSSSVQLPIANLARGMYLIMIESPTAIGTKKLIKN